MDRRADLIDLGFSSLGLACLCLVAVLAWLLGHRLSRRIERPLPRLVMLAIRIAIGALTLWLVWQLLARVIHFATDWSLVAIAITGAVIIELASELFRHERGIVSKRNGRLLQALRTAAIVTVMIILLQPMKTTDLEREMQRQLVILVDDSASMGLADQQLNVSEKLRVAALFGVEAASRDKTLAQVERSLALLDKRLAVESAALQTPEGVSSATANTLIAKRVGPLKAFMEREARATDTLAKIVANQRGRFTALSDDTRNLLSDYDKRIRENISRDLGRAAIATGKGDYANARATMHSISRQIRFILEKLPAAAFEIDSLHYQALSEDERSRIDAASSNSRARIAREILRTTNDDGESIIDRLREDYLVRFVRFADGAAEMDGDQWLSSGDGARAQKTFLEAKQEAARIALEEMDPDAPAATPEENAEPIDPGAVESRQLTDFADAFDAVLEKVSSSDLAGVLALSDGRHNGERAAEEGARRMGLQDVPVCSVVVGSKIGPRDAAVLAVRTPESIYQDDRAVIQADLKLDGLRGQTVQVALLESGREIGSETIEVTDQALRTTVRFAHTPQAIGIFRYEIAIRPITGEVFSDNNRWKFQVAVTDDRTNVLLVDGYPRWEFRYLRNLFYARDKSVHLQHVLLAPDRIAGANPPPLIPASASRRFGDAEATALPVSREEWLKFDAIILGDIPPSAISPEDWQAIRYAVAERGALLITIAGPRFMPHAFSEPTFLEMLPARFEVTPGRLSAPPEAAYRLRLSAAGSSHLIMQQSLDPNINNMVWGGLPPLFWRHPIEQVKEAATVLAWAEPVSGALTPGAFNSAATAEEVRTTEQRNALVVSQRYALGRSLLLNFDQTWRLRYGVGDVYHHKFWGQILRWGTGENLRAGNERVRLGTDKLSYASGEAVQIIAKALDERFQPLQQESLTAAIYNRDRLIMRKQLDYRASSNGIFEGQVQAPVEPGRYRVALEGLSGEAIETEIIVNADRNAVELAELTADAGFLGQLAALSGGAVADPDNAESLLPFFRDPGRVIVERREVSLWDNPLLLIPFFLFLGFEWALRRRSGLA